VLKGSFGNTTVIPLFIWNFYILNCQQCSCYVDKLSVAVFSVSAVTQIRHYCFDPTFYQKPTPLFAAEALLSRHERTPTTLLQPFHEIPLAYLSPSDDRGRLPFHVVTTMPSENYSCSRRSSEMSDTQLQRQHWSASQHWSVNGNLNATAV